ncbi:hypothetical protein [Dictyobacter formicarum]|uniref:PhoD-like phosphatase metallophosphatase domain-containing protein n=1 Tax=Dictyobacter formicarum TaxID=2778368 RepID=A0ABQ3VH42_9CHLR|nr:hypothetical protein [Dictyobacter formicarum]GHO85490.1 hypothetical protein KSZ_34960 [Dictyobacter formicarum]
MSWASLAERIEQLPLILAGPIVRRVESTQVTVWLALKEARNVTLCIYARDEHAQLQEQARGTHRTIRIGDNLHLVAVTARVSREATKLAWGELYYYNLYFGDEEQSTAEMAHLGTPGILTADINEAEPLQSIVYPGQPLPGFLVPAEDVHDLRIIHGSCRKPHGTGKETLSAVDSLIANACQQNGTARPQQLYMTGDQIYADDVATPLLHTLTDAGHILLAGNQKEILPGSQLPADKFLPRMRKNVILNQARFTTGHADNHLISFAEYIAMYLFSWSDVLWPKEMLSVEAFWAWLYPGVHAESVSQEKEQTHYREELQQLASFHSTLPKVRRALANIATYMICDDHDVTDDWFLDENWCQHVLQKPLGRRIIRNGLLAYALCQAWGNTPEQFAEPNGAALLAAVDSWRGDENTKQAEIIATTIGMPNRHFSGKGSLQRSEQALRWHYSYEGPNYQLIVMDTRTQRHYCTPKDFPGLLSEEAMRTQIEQIECEDAEVTLIISATPVIGVDFVETVQFWSRWRVTDNYAFDREAWALEWGTFQSFLRTLSNLKRVVFLSGDVHYAFGSSLEYWDIQTRQSAKFINFTSSPYCNEGSGAQISVLAVGYPRLRSLLRGGKEPRLDFFVWDILGHDHHTLNYLLATIRKQLFRFWWSVPRLIAAQRSPSEIVMPAWGWVKGAFDNIPPSRSYRIRYLTNDLKRESKDEHRPHINLTRFTLRPLRAALGGINILQILNRRIQGKLRARTAPQIEPNANSAKENLLEEVIEQSEKIERKLERPRSGLMNAVLNYNQWLSRWKAGNLIVGYNNISEISFHWNNEKKEVTQKLWWYNPDNAEQLLAAEYADTLELPRPGDEPPLP